MADPDALRYLQIAQADLEEAQRMLALSGFRDRRIVFRLQQACEKALKGWIHAKGGQAPFTHDHVAWLDWLEESGSELSAFETIADLSCFADQSRYACSVAIHRQIGNSQQGPASGCRPALASSALLSCFTAWIPSWIPAGDN
jgi:HEPN domain-containing protein